MKVLDPNRRGLKLTVVVLSEDEAIKLEELSRLKVGMTSCRSATKGGGHEVLQVPRVLPPKKDLQGGGPVLAVLQMRRSRSPCKKLHGNAEMFPVRKRRSRGRLQALGRLECLRRLLTRT